MNLLALTVVTVNIASGVAASQLTEFGAQSHAQLLFNFEEMKKYQTNAVQGTMDTFIVLDRMIEGTPLHYEYINNRTVTITASPTPSAVPADDALTTTLIADGCAFGLISSQVAAHELGDVPQACWCCVSYEHADAGSVKEAFCIALPSRNACSAYDSPSQRNFWSSGVTSEVVISGKE